MGMGNDINEAILVMRDRTIAGSCLIFLLQNLAKWFRIVCSYIANARDGIKH